MKKVNLWAVYGIALINRDGGLICHYCGKAVIRTIKAVPTQATIDHVKPKSKGGKTELDNLVIACLNCNRKKASKRYLDFFFEKIDEKKKRIRKRGERYKEKRGKNA